ncbi:MAG: uracil-DNA glycosylase [Dehalococcoidales bacterium]|nr:uracil-DNA glycosylase [Dehalococcoidales bacterium]
MRVGDILHCNDLPCSDADTRSYAVPDADMDPAAIRILMITEAPPNDTADYFYAPGNPFYLQTVMQAFRDAGAAVTTIRDILDMGIYITTAVKCGKTGYAISPQTIQRCSRLLEEETGLFPNLKVFMLMGDVAIRMMNGIWKKQTGAKVIPAGSTYKIRGQAYYLGDKRVLPSYTPAGKNFLIEKSKRRMVAEDIRTALATP